MCRRSNGSEFETLASCEQTSEACKHTTDVFTARLYCRDIAVTKVAAFFMYPNPKILPLSIITCTRNNHFGYIKTPPCLTTKRGRRLNMHKLERVVYVGFVL